MVVQTPQEAVENANRYHTCVPGHCLQYVRTWLEIGSRDPTAISAWNNAARRHPGDRSVPAGFPKFWSGGSRGFGHIALEMKGNDEPTRSTDVTSAGMISTVPLSWFDSHWSSMHYLGWTEDLNGILLPYHDNADANPKPVQSRWASGDVYVEKLHKGQRDSDSVARLCYRMVTLNAMPGTHRPQKMTRFYNQDLLEAVRYWQRNLIPKVKGPSDGTKVSNAQADKLFGDNYTLHKK